MSYYGYPPGPMCDECGADLDMMCDDDTIDELAMFCEECRARVDMVMIGYYTGVSRSAWEGMG